MSVDIATLGIKVDSRQVKQADADLEKLAKTGKKTENATKDLTRGMSGLTAAFAALGIGAVVMQATRMADTWKNVQGRLGLVTDGTGALASVTQALFEVSNRTRNSFEATADLYANLARTTKVLGASQNQLLQVTESISQALIVSGATAAGSEAALRQLGQAFASGALRGDELNSIMENTPRIASAIADGMGITIGQLRALGKEGKLTADAIFMALLSQKETLESEFAQMPVTVAQSFTVLRNEIMKYVGDADNLSGATSAIAGAITGLSKAVNIVIPSILALATALGVGFVTNAIAAKVAASAATTALGSMALAARTAGASLLAAFGGPIGVAITGVGLALAYLYGQSISATSAIKGAEGAVKDANTRLEVAIARATEAGVSVATLGNAASSSTPLINTIANAYKNAGDKAAYLAQKAKEAAIAVAQGNIADLQRKKQAALGPLNVVDETTRALKADPWKLQPGKFFKRGLGMLSQQTQEIMGGPTETQRRLEAMNYDKAMRLERETIRTIEATPGSAFGETPLNRIPVSEKDKKDKPKRDAKSEAERELEQQTKAAKEFSDSLRIETSEIGKNAVEVRMMAAQRAAALAPTQALKDEILESAEAWKKKNNEEANKNFKRDISDQVNQLQYENTLIGMSAVEIEKSNFMRVMDMKIRDAARQGIEIDIENVRKETEAYLGAIDARERHTEGVRKATEFADEMRDATIAVREMTEGFGELFGTAGEGFSNLINTMFEYSEAQAEIAQRQAELQREGKENTAEYDRLEQESTRNRIASYGNMLGAAKTFFKEGSTGWKIMEGAERAYRLFQFAMQVKAILLDTVQTGTSVANSGARAAASGVEAVAKAMASLPPPFNFIAAGAVIAFLVAMGVKMVGGKGKGGGATSSAASSAAKATEAYMGPRDQYGAPTSSYSVLRPGSTVANDNRVTPVNGSSFNGGGVNIGPTTLIVEGSLDSATLPQVEAMLTQNRQETVQEARRVVVRDIAERGSRQRIGG